MVRLESVVVVFLFSFISIILLSSSLPLAHSRSSHDPCEPRRCSKGSPLIRFPFRIQELHPPHCGYPGFNLSCNTSSHHPTLHIPSLGQPLLVKSVDYKLQKLVVTDPNGCLHGLLFNSLAAAATSLFPSSSRLRFYQDPANHTLLRCSKNAVFDESLILWIPISCLSDSGHDYVSAYADTEVSSVPVSCRPIKMVEIPSLYYVDARGYDWEQCSGDCEFLMDLRWDVPGCGGGCEMTGGECRFRNQSSSGIICFYHDKGFWTKYTIIGLSLGSFLLFAIAAIGFKVYRSWKLDKKLDLENHIMVEKFLEDYKSLKPTRYSFADLKKMTNHFKEKLGQGSYGSVYKGKLPSGTCVAVKVLKSFGGDGVEFINEVGTIGMIHHVNVVRLLGFCADRLKHALVYEFLPNQSLERFIFNRNNSNLFLGWEKLQDIAVGIARGIEYLHQGCDQRILHFDIKPHIILLDQNFNPKISDFGLAKLCSTGQSVVSLAAARGTMGYIAPEVFSRNFGSVSCKSDVYSFGMLVLEMVGGRKNNEVTAESSSQGYFPEWIYHHLCEGEDMGHGIIVDEDAKIAKKLATVALWCIQWSPADRPSMTTVVQMLEGSVEGLTMPPNPFASTGQMNEKNTHFTGLSTILE